MDFAPHYASLPAIEILLMTAAAESDFGTYLYQKKGPAKGLFQIRIPTTASTPIISTGAGPCSGKKTMMRWFMI